MLIAGIIEISMHSGPFYSIGPLIVFKPLFLHLIQKVPRIPTYLIEVRTGLVWKYISG